MRRRLPLILLLPLAAAVARAAGEPTVRDDGSNFEISLPELKAGDWDKITNAERTDIKAHFRTEFTGTDPLAFAEVQVMVVANKSELAQRKLASLAMQWAESMEAVLTNPREIKEGPLTLGGQEAYFRDLQGDYISGVGHITWYLTRMGKLIYVIHVLRAYKAVGDESLEAEILEIRDSFKFLRVEEVKADSKAKGKDKPAGPAGAGGAPKGAEKETIDPELTKAAPLKNDFWRFECVKPEGVLSIPPEKFDNSETTNNVVAKFTMDAEQTRLMIRIYAQSENAQQFTIEQHAERTLKQFETTYAEKSRLEPEIDNDYHKKFPLAKKAIRMKLVGRRTVPETTYWYLAQCKNDRQYRIEIYVTGATGEKQWEKQIQAFLKSFKPQKD
jgi:hypothetical protein